MAGRGDVGEVEEDDVEAHEADEGGEGEDDEGDVGEGGRVDQVAGLWRLDAHPHDGDGDEQSAEGHEGHDADGPGESDAVDEPV